MIMRYTSVSFGMHRSVSTLVHCCEVTCNWTQLSNKKWKYQSYTSWLYVRRISHNRTVMRKLLQCHEVIRPYVSLYKSPVLDLSIGHDHDTRQDHYNDVIMRAMLSQITSLMIVYSTVYSGTDQRKHQSSALLAFVRGIHRWPVNSPHKGPVMRKMYPFDDIIIQNNLISLKHWTS